MKEKGSVLIIVLIGLLFILSGGGIYYFYKYKFPKQIIPQIATPSPKTNNISQQSLPSMSPNQVTSEQFSQCLTNDPPYQPSAESVSSRCPIYLLKKLKDIPINVIAENHTSLDLFQGKILYIFYNKKPKYDFNSVLIDAKTNTYSYDKDFELDQTLDVTINGTLSKAEVISWRSCKEKTDESCHEVVKRLLIKLPEGFWLELVADSYEEIFSYGQVPELVKAEKIIDPQERIPVTGK